MNVAALASTSHQPGLFDMVASPWFWVRVGGSKPPGSYTAYCPNVNLAEAGSPGLRNTTVPQPSEARPPCVDRSRRSTVSRLGSPKPSLMAPGHGAPRRVV